MWVTEGRCTIDNELSSRSLEMDSAGFVVIQVDHSSSELVVECYAASVNSSGIVCDPKTSKPIPANGKIPYEKQGEVRGRTAKETCVRLFECGEGIAAITMHNHAAYLGRELVFAELSLRDGRAYVQD